MSGSAGAHQSKQQPHGAWLPQQLQLLQIGGPILAWQPPQASARPVTSHGDSSNMPLCEIDDDLWWPCRHYKSRWRPHMHKPTRSATDQEKEEPEAKAKEMASTVSLLKCQALGTRYLPEVSRSAGVWAWPQFQGLPLSPFFLLPGVRAIFYGDGVGGKPEGKSGSPDKGQDRKMNPIGIHGEIVKCMERGS